MSRAAALSYIHASQLQWHENFAPQDQALGYLGIKGITPYRCNSMLTFHVSFCSCPHFLCSGWFSDAVLHCQRSDIW